jgi:hydrogenase nickel incorporation protein HypA/HybF
MHEQGLIDQLIKKILAIALEKQATQISRITVKLGALSHMNPSHFKEHFDISAKGTLAEDAELITEQSSDIYEPNAHHVTLVSIDVAVSG